MTPITIKKATLADHAILQEIGRQTFSETFAGENKKEDMEKYLAESFSIERLGTELQDPHAEFYFATIDGKVMGYLKLNFGPSQTEFKDEKAVEIERIYVMKEYHGKKVGQLLYEQAIHIARQKKADYVWLGVWENNPRAISFYKKNGFSEFDTHIFKLGDDDQTDILMKLSLGN